MELLYTAHVPDGEGPFPTIVLLHGWGASAHDLLGLAPVLHGGRALVLSPQGPVGFRMDADPGQPSGTVGYGWFPLGGGRPPDPGEFARATGSVSRFIDAACALYPVDPGKLLVLGFSQGGTIAYDLALRDPKRFAGLVALSSWLPPEIVAQVEPSEDHRNLQALVVHGSEDPMIPSERGRESRDALLKLCVTTVYREFPMGHEIRPEALRLLLEWIEERVFTPVLTL